MSCCPKKKGLLDAGHESIRVALVGNPNIGKTTLFNSLTGYNRHVANYPGVTVEIATGPIRGAKYPFELIDLPGTYSLAAASPDESIVTDALCGRSCRIPTPDCLLAIVDASNLTRNLYLVSQLLEFGYPLVVAVNMIDVAARRGIGIDADVLTKNLGVPVIPIVATKPETVRPLVKALEESVTGPKSSAPTSRDLVTGAAPTLAVKMPGLPDVLLDEANQLLQCDRCAIHPAEAIRTLLYPRGHAEDAYRACGGCGNRLAEARKRLADAGIDGPTREIQSRYAWIAQMIDGAITRPDRPINTWSDRFDAILTHKISGVIVMLVVFFLMFTAIFSGAAPLMGLVEGGIGAVGGWVSSLMSPGVWRSLIVDGLIAGVGGVLVFLPQILILFAFIAVLEDCGYLSRAAYMMDRLMRTVGLSGRSFIPLLSGFACAVPAIMGTRAIPDKRERFLAILITPFMSCSARLPIYVIFIAAFVPTNTSLGSWLQPMVMMAMYLVGIVVAIPVSWILKKTLLAGGMGGFILELPTYKSPRIRAIWQRMSMAGKDFLWRAGTVILLVNMVVWALAYFPRSEATRTSIEQLAAAQQWDEARTAHELDGAYLRESYLGQMGHAIEPAIRPMGWDWKVGVGVIASFPAREVIIATLGTLFNLGGELDEESDSLQQAMLAAKREGTDEKLFTLPVALSIMVFFALCAQCGATLVTIKKETNSWLYPALSFTMMTIIAYFASWAVAAGARGVGL